MDTDFSTPLRVVGNHSCANFFRPLIELFQMVLGELQRVRVYGLRLRPETGNVRQIGQHCFTVGWVAVMQQFAGKQVIRADAIELGRAGCLPGFVQIIARLIQFAFPQRDAAQQLIAGIDEVSVIPKIAGGQVGEHVLGLGSGFRKIGWPRFQQQRIQDLLQQGALGLDRKSVV